MCHHNVETRSIEAIGKRHRSEEASGRFDEPDAEAVDEPDAEAVDDPKAPADD